MTWESWKHNIKWDSKLGNFYRYYNTFIGLLLLKHGRKFLTKGSSRCTWCGNNCGFDSVISNKGLRCDSITRNCTKY